MLRLLIYLLCAFLTAFFLILALAKEPRDVWLSCFSAILSISVTVIIIEQLISRDKKKKEFPAHYAAYCDTFLVYSRCCSLWFEMVKAAFISDRDSAILDHEDIQLMDSRLGRIVAFLLVESNAPVIPTRTWRQHIFEQIKEIEDRVDKCLSRYAAFIDPELIKILQDIERSSFVTFGKLSLTLHRTDIELGIERPYFGWGAHDENDFINAVNALGLYLQRHRNKYDGMPRISDIIDLEHQDKINAIRQLIPVEDEPEPQSESI